MEYTVKRGITGDKVLYACPHCAHPLESKLDEAGIEDGCPQCSRLFIVPGKKELDEIRTAQQAEQKRKDREAAEYAIQSAAAQAKISKERAARELARSQAALHEAVGESRRRQLVGETAVDRLLRWGFSFGKGVSVIIVIGCFLTMAVALIWLATISERMPATFVPSVVAPTLAEFQKDDAAPAPRAGDSSSPSETPAVLSNSPQAQLDRLLRQDPDLSDEHRQWIENKLTGVNYDQQENFVAGMETLIKSLHSTGQTRVYPAAGWYAAEFEFRAENAAAAERTRENERMRASIEAGLRRTTALGTAGGAFATLLVFLFLPLAIQIEKNTRRLIEIRAIEDGWRMDALAPNPASAPPSAGT